jgi:PAS domain
MGDVHPTTGVGPEPNVAEAAGFGAWTDHQIPEDRSGWHPMVRRFYEYWLSVAPPGHLPGRQHIQPEDLVPLLPRLWMVDVFRDPLRFRYRLVGTKIVQSVDCELTGRWLDEVQPEVVANPMARDRYRFVAETGRPTWRRGPIYWKRDPKQQTIENCMVPLAADGVTVDKIFAVSVAFDANGREVS